MYNTTPAVVKIGMCSLNNNPLNFNKNRDNIIQSIVKCKQLGCSMRVGNEMEISGYLCGDHHLEYDTMVHTWEIIRDILKSNATKGIVCDIGVGIVHNGDLYNCRIILMDGFVKGIRAKMNLAENSGYFQNRWFSPWKEKRQIEQFVLPPFIQELTGQTTVPIGQFLLQFNDTVLAYEVCQEAWTPNNPMIDAALNGAQIFVNTAFSYVQRGKLKSKMKMFQQLTDRYGGSYLYVNAKGAQGQRTYMIGDCIFAQNGQIRELAPINNLDDVSVTPALINLTSIRANRLSNKSFSRSSKGVSTIPRVKIPINVANCRDQYIANQPKQLKRVQSLIEDYQFPHARYEPSLFLWDYLRKCKARGFFLLLDGGIDTTAVAMTVYNMCQLLYKQISQKNNKNILIELQSVLSNNKFCPKSPQQICNNILFTCFMWSSSSNEQSVKLTQNIAKMINSQHHEVNFGRICGSYLDVCREVINLNYQKQQNQNNVNQSLLDMQSRQKMSLAYFLSQNKTNVTKGKNYLLVLTSLNLDDQLIGNFTKYGTTAGDINPIGSFSRMRVKQFLNWNQEIYQFQFIKQAINGNSGCTKQQKQIFSQSQLAIFGKLRKIDKLGPISMFNYLLSSKLLNYNAQKIAQKVKQFFKTYSNNRHKIVSTTPSFYFNPQDCFDNRADVRPMYYETNWQYQFDLIDQKAKQASDS